jgi:hypothetical protein
MRVLKITATRYLVVSDDGTKLYKEFTNKADAEGYKKFLNKINADKQKAEQGVTK